MRRRLILSYLALTVVILAILEVPLALTYAQRQRDQLQSNLLRDAFTLASYVEDSLEGRNDLDLPELARNYQDRTGARVVIVDETGEVKADSAPPVEGARSFASRPEIAQALTQGANTGTRLSDTLGTELVYVAVPVSSGGNVHGAVRLSFSTAQVDARVHRYWWLLAGVAAVSLGLAALVGALLARWATRPIEQLRDAATAFGGGDLSSRAPTDSGPPELRELARAFNTTAARLEQLVSAQEEFVADASHQLRTPLTALRLRLEMLADEVDGEGAADVAAARAEVLRLSRLVDGLLALARAEREAPSATITEVDLDAMLAERAAVWEPLAGERGLEVRADPAGLRARATPDRLVQVLDNLIANAVDAAPAGTTVELRACRDGTDGRVEVHVVDHGPGLTEEQRSRAFDRFWRAMPGRSATTEDKLGGSGLGLAIVQKLAQADEGRVSLRQTPGGGLDAVVTLPGA